MREERQYNLDLIRCAAFLLVFTFHFALTVQEAGAGIKTGVRGYDFGSLGTGLFFILSGFVLTLGSQRASSAASFSVPRFYKKRFLAIYPLYWMVFLAVYLIHGWHGGNFLYGGPLWKLIYSVAAVDGYLNLYGIQTYYVTGEWFIAVILFCYLLYPLLRKIKPKIAVLIAATALYAANIHFGLQKGIPADASLITGLLLFYIGMILAELFANLEDSEKEEYHSNSQSGFPQKQKPHGIAHLHINSAAAAAACIILLLLPGAGQKPLVLRNLFSLLLFIFLYEAFRSLKGKTGKAFAAVSRYTYAAFLWHHVILSWTAGRIMNVFAFAGGFRYAAAYLGALGMTLVFSVITVYIFRRFKGC